LLFAPRPEDFQCSLALLAVPIGRRLRLDLERRDGTAGAFRYADEIVETEPGCRREADLAGIRDVAHGVVVDLRAHREARPRELLVSCGLLAPNRQLGRREPYVLDAAMHVNAQNAVGNERSGDSIAVVLDGHFDNEVGWRIAS